MFVVVFKNYMIKKYMKTYTSFDGIVIKVGENAKENDNLTLSSYPNEWWMHVDGGPGAHVVICHEENTIPKETKRDAAFLAVHHSKPSNTKIVRVNLVRIDQVIKDDRIKNHGQVYLNGQTMQLVVSPNKEQSRLNRLTKSLKYKI
jgi:predicted ribosome quality control (RQC) complex YloA/Tae2 family protein